MDTIADIQKLLKNQRAQMRIVSKMVNLLFETQQEIDKKILIYLKSLDTPTDADVLLTSDEATKLLKISSATLARKKKSGEIPCLQKGRGKKILFSRNALLEYLKTSK